ncbi:hypothetical protein [Desulfovibrio ferrophilus]|uniref:Uncharacterized protein n=1 Tax=Desulfovibrio ferrophilus TaxID=241368 RepID=A0A2Z6AVM3_9BACT|nr:hypothetical protein [Desulfovibrio ferrophilus]BBD07287.1 uncharacterized protein DFE_0561 [Desulfovibrio ferrophilus]
MNKLFPTLLACALFLLPAQPVRCADDTGLLNELSLAMEEEEVKVSEEVDRSFPAQITRNLDLSVRLRGSHQFHNARDLGGSVDQDKQDDYGEIKIEFGSSYENENIRLAFSGWLETGNQKDTYKGEVGLWQDNDRRRNILEINELYLTFPISDLSLTAGKRIIENSISTLYSPANRYNSFDLNDPLDPHQFGTWQLALEGDTSDVSWMLALLPVFQTPKTPSEESRWMGGSSADGELAAYYSNTAYSSREEFYAAFREELYFFEWLLEGEDGEFTSWLTEQLLEEFGWVSTTSEDISVHYETPDEPSVFAQAKTSVGDWDFLFSAFHGPSIYPVLGLDLDRATPGVALTVEHPTVTQIAGGLSTTWKELEFHGEALFNISDDGKDDDYLQYVIGTRWTNESLANKIGLYRIDCGLEYAGEMITQDQDASGYVISSREIRIGRNDIIAGMVLHFTEDLRLHYLADFELTNKTNMNRVGLGWDITDNLNADVSAEYFNGPARSYYGYWNRQDRVVATLTYKFN